MDRPQKGEKRSGADSRISKSFAPRSVGEPVAAPAVRASICPYRGLEPFREEDSAFFCGRDDAIRELVARVQEHEFVAVVGPSGSGKSSLVFAGLLPALRKQLQTTMWDVVTLRPGKRPVHALAEAFGTLPDGAGEFEMLSRSKRKRRSYVPATRTCFRARSTAASTPRRRSRTAC